MILIPVKNLATAKQRLAAFLSQPVRTELAQNMLLDVCEAIAMWTDRPPVSIVSSDPFAIEVGQQFGFEIVPDEVNRSETDAIEMATKICESRGVSYTLVIPADIPLIQTRELEQILARAPEHGSVLAPASDGRGTNAAFRRPAGLFPLRFGNDSFKPHLAAARATGLPCTVLSLPGIALDIDNPGDLRQLAEAPGKSRSQQFARQWDLRDFTLAASD